MTDSTPAPKKPRAPRKPKADPVTPMVEEEWIIIPDHRRIWDVARNNIGATNNSDDWERIYEEKKRLIALNEPGTLFLPGERVRVR